MLSCCVPASIVAAIYMQWCLPWLPTDRISRLVLLNTALPPHPLFRELGLANALLIAIWQATVTLVGRYVEVRGALARCEPVHRQPAMFAESVGGLQKPFGTGFSTKAFKSPCLSTITRLLGINTAIESSPAFLTLPVPRTPPCLSLCLPACP